MDHHQKRTLILYLLHRRRQKNKKTGLRRFWIHPLIEQRNEFGVINTLFPELRRDDKKFFNYFRMSVTTFDDLLGRLEHKIARENTIMRDSIQPIEMLAVTIRYLASGCSFTDLHYSYRLGISTISCIVRHVCCNIWEHLREQFMPFPSKERWKLIATNFQEKADFPNCLGAIDGKHIRIIKPQNSGSMYFNYKDYFSIVLLAVADADYRFNYVDIGAYGKDCDSAIFKKSSFWNLISQNALGIPEPTCPVGTSESLPYMLIGDEAFALTTNLLRPFGGNNLSVQKKIFNYRLSRARRYVECSFGILSNKWRIFHRPLNVSEDLATDIVKACCMLHNFVREIDGFNFEDLLEVTGLEDVQQSGNGIRGGKSSNDIRNKFTNYFMSDAGAIPWQFSKI